MKINKITLSNIRSYKSQEIEFPLGTVLLSGEVGSGKSSVLLALDFALFGLRTGSLPGGSLLRKGENKGFVELLFELGGRNVRIRRNLKKQGDSIVQEPGFIEIDSEREDLSPIELKERVLSLLKYPKDLLMKSKSLIYRYTVYTPQEEMKSILLGNKDYRLETLRKVFGVDKYKRMKDNTIIYVNHLKGIRKELAGRIADLDEKILMKKEVDGSISEVKNKILEVDEKIKDFKNLLETRDKEISLVEENINLFKELQKQVEVSLFELKSKSSLKERNVKEIKESLEKISELIIKEEVFVDEKIIIAKEKDLRLVEEKLSDWNAKIGGLKNKIGNSEEIKSKIKTMDFCPLCKQKVTKEHIRDVVAGEDEKIKKAQESLDLTEKEIEKYNSDVKFLKEEIENWKKQISLAETYKLKKKILREKEDSVERLQKENLLLDKEVVELKENQRKLSEKIKGLGDVKEKYDVLIKEKNKLNEEYMRLEVEKGGFVAELNSFSKRLEELKKEILDKSENKKDLLYWTRIQDWLIDYFVNLMDVIEKKVLLKVHTDFDSLFQDWFNMLIDNEMIKVDLDEEFTPVVEQNGHVIDYSYLSGGEKTAAALAYRLALNQVINDLVGVIETKDLIILDEPTDGFSDEQLDRLRDVIKELNVNQTILVSHESKIESFVDSVIRIAKKEHVSEVMV
ncbi:MAG: AAA family ATPase [Candidatus Woesearchaeota archaeon]